jgi:nitrogen-specific signal transduction histidine kinase/ActR/RegA family two-component response regulator
MRYGVPVGAVTAFVDITESKRLEAQLLQSQKMESIGQFAGGIAHDFNNILSVILGYGEMVLADMAEDDPLRPKLAHMIEAGDRAAHLTKDLLLFSRKQALDRKPVDLNKIINKMESFLVSVIGEDISFNTRLHEEELLVFADAHQFEQVMMNLATNARDSMPKGGAFTISSEPVMLDEEFTYSHGLGMPGRYALISISDTGHGMNTEIKGRIFEPFFTTKDVGKGTGLGLSVAYGIIKQHEGYINVYSEPGIGTTFRIYLQVITSWPKGAKEQPATKTPERGTETVLLAEDDEKVRNLLLTGLRNFGYTVIEAVDGEDAVHKYREHKDRIELLIFDLIMPKKSGNEAYDEIRKIKPDIKILFVTGYSPDIVRVKASIENPAAIIYKPFSSTDLLNKARSILDEDKAISS